MQKLISCSLKRLFFAVGLAVSLLLSGLDPAFADSGSSNSSNRGKNPPPPQPSIVQMMLSPVLRLTSDQRTAVKILLANYQQAEQTYTAAVKTAVDALLEYERSGAFDATQLSTLSAAVDTANANLRNDQLQIAADIYKNILTAPQQATVNSTSVAKLLAPPRRQNSRQQSGRR